MIPTKVIIEFIIHNEWEGETMLHAHRFRAVRFPDDPFRVEYSSSVLSEPFAVDPIDIKSQMENIMIDFCVEHNIEPVELDEVWGVNPKYRGRPPPFHPWDQPSDYAYKPFKVRIKT